MSAKQAPPSAIPSNQETDVINRTTWLVIISSVLMVVLASGCSMPSTSASSQPTPTLVTPTLETTTGWQGGSVPTTEALLTWEGHTIIGDNDKEGCHRLIVTVDRQARFGPCSATPSTTQFSAPQWDEIIAHFAPFESSTAEMRIVFRGQGQVAGAAWQRAITAWIHDTYARLLTGRACAACGTVMNWSFGSWADRPGFCSNLWATNYGYAYSGLAPCTGGQTEIVAQGWLETDEWVQLDAWLSEHAETYMGEGGVNYLAGRGKQTMSEAEQVELARWAQKVSARLTPSTPAEATVVPVTPTASWAISTPDAAQAELDAFEARLTRALAARDYADLGQLMGSEFILVFWLSDGHPYTPQQAVQELRQNQIGANTELAFHSAQDLIGAQDAIQSLFRPQVDVVKLIWVQGWGREGRDEAVLYIARRPDGHLYWHGALSAPGRFAGEPMPPSAAHIAPNTLDTGVHYVTALADLPVYRGEPGDTRSQVNTVAGGQTVMVTGISADGKWWRVLCPGDKVGPCWATTRAQQTRPRVVMPSSQIAPQTVFVQWKSLMALQDAPVYQGDPGDTRTRVATIASGQMALVTGASSDGMWWRVVCPDDTVGNCWVSSHPDWTMPQTASISSAPIPGSSRVMLVSGPFRMQYTLGEY